MILDIAYTYMDIANLDIAFATLQNFSVGLAPLCNIFI